MNKKIHTKISVFIVLVLLVGISMNIGLNSKTFEDNLKNDLNNSLTVLSPFVIGGPDGDYLWEMVVAQPWCSGEGTPSSPYVIEDIIIDGGGSESCLKIQNSNASFIIRNSIFSYAEATDMGAAIKLVNTNNGSLVNNNCSLNEGMGIYLYNCNSIKIINNTLNYNSFGLHVDEYSSNLEVSGNDIRNNERGIDTTGFSNNFTHNQLDFNNILGFSMHNSEFNIIRNCSFINTRLGFAFGGGGGSHSNMIIGNTFANNSLLGILTNVGNDDNLFTQNVFLNNTTNANEESTNYWNSTEIGNFWDDYTGDDFDDNGIGDTPHNVSVSPLNQDMLPIWDDGDDPTPPELSIVDPLTNKMIGPKSPTFQLSSKSLYINTTWYNLNGTTANYTFSGFEGIINQGAWDQFSDGYIPINFYINDTLGNENSATVLVEKESVLPIIVIYSPEEEEVFKIAPTFNITVIEEYYSSSWYSIDGGITNFTISQFIDTINQIAWDDAPRGNITISFYAQDEAGNIGYQEVIVIKEIPSGPSEVIPGYNLIVIFAMLGLFILWITKKRYKFTQ